MTVWRSEINNASICEPSRDTTPNIRTTNHRMTPNSFIHSYSTHTLCGKGDFSGTAINLFPFVKSCFSSSCLCRKRPPQTVLMDSETRFFPSHRCLYFPCGAPSIKWRKTVISILTDSRRQTAAFTATALYFQDVLTEVELPQAPPACPWLCVYL